MPIDGDKSNTGRDDLKNRAPAKGDRLMCGNCGLIVSIEEINRSAAFAEPVCCAMPMKLHLSNPVNTAISLKTRGRQAGSSRYQGVTIQKDTQPRDDCI
ncbi:hypothetical protein [Dehalogenimonas etheniformans]|uniref:Desulfoferrodoxin N-terminal domain-containing protein n=1 Tax=Dehalogenimonas etheniformans TaxID=1536648 RepID=A0A2P5P8Y4_9CHLR|nr:hypothetical protein [Dehalogenimonas etheniformans]PPD58757.1 hypothetical protein JP09_002475 [Dehalogenimonas etheniformans]QNT76472.1 hypothetical protein HX448_07150 [Dehalogenimonas etheniformans]